MAGVASTITVRAKCWRTRGQELPHKFPLGSQLRESERKTKPSIPSIILCHDCHNDRPSEGLSNECRHSMKQGLCDINPILPQKISV
jgi:hypothetical protein